MWEKVHFKPSEYRNIRCIARISANALKPVSIRSDNPNFFLAQYALGVTEPRFVEIVHMVFVQIVCTVQGELSRARRKSRLNWTSDKSYLVIKAKEIKQSKNLEWVESMKHVLSRWDLYLEVVGWSRCCTTGMYFPNWCLACRLTWSSRFCWVACPDISINISLRFKRSLSWIFFSSDRSS